MGVHIEGLNENI